MNLYFVYATFVGIQLCFARPTGECSTDVVLAFTSSVGFVPNNGSNAWHNAGVFGKLWHISFYISLKFGIWYWLNECKCLPPGVIYIHPVKFVL